MSHAPRFDGGAAAAEVDAGAGADAAIRDVGADTWEPVDAGAGAPDVSEVPDARVDGAAGADAEVPDAQVDGAAACEDGDPECFRDFPACKPVLPGHNDRFGGRVEWVFVGYRFAGDRERLRDLIREAVAFDGGSDWSLMNVAPFRERRDAINLWYVDAPGDYDDLRDLIRLDAPLVRADSLLRACPRFPNQHVVVFQDTWDGPAMAETVSHSCLFGDCTNTAGGAYMERGYIWMFSEYPLVAEGAEATRHYLAHEWGHVFGRLDDQYVTEDDRAQGHSRQPADVCGAWCEGPFLSWDELRGDDCASAGDREACDARKMQYHPCLWDDVGCVNVVDRCAALETIDTCLEVPFCGWLTGVTEESWHRAPCFPWNSGLAIEDVVRPDRREVYVRTTYPVIDVGGGCLPETGCFTSGARNLGSFRADAHSLMREDFSNSYGAYQNGRVVEVIRRIRAGTYDGGFWEYHEGDVPPQ